MPHCSKSKMGLQIASKAKRRGALQRSTLRRMVNQEEHVQVPDQLMDWAWAIEKRLKELQRDFLRKDQILIAMLKRVFANKQM
jgi:hypothetical protein